MYDLYNMCIACCDHGIYVLGGRKKWPNGVVKHRFRLWRLEFVALIQAGDGQSSMVGSIRS